MFTGVSLYTEYLDNMLNAWAVLPSVQPNVTLDAPSTYYTSGNAGYATLTSAPNWIINTAGTVSVSSVPTNIQPGSNTSVTLTLSSTLPSGSYTLINTADSSILSTATLGTPSSSITFDNVILPYGGTYVLSLRNAIGGYIVSGFPLNVNSICFKEDTKILCLKNGTEQYIPIQNLRKGDLVKTVLSGYVPIYMIGKTQINNRATQERIKEQLYRCSRDKYPELFEDLIITGCHSILVNNFASDKQREESIRLFRKIYVTDRKYRLAVCIDTRAKPFEKKGFFNIYHFSLENNDYCMNYGIYANGLLVETCSKRYLKELSNMEILN
jgi:hypothetical protein